MWERLKLFLNPLDARYEDLLNRRWQLIVLRDFSAGLIVAMMAIPMAMGFAMASGLKPEQGIVGGAIAGLVGALFGGSKYQVYGPTAAFIPVIAGLMLTYTPLVGFQAAHGMLVLAALFAGLILIVMGLAGLGRLANLVPHSIVVGFTIGIAVTIALSQVGEVFGIHAGFKLTEKQLDELRDKKQMPDSVRAKLEPFVGQEYETRGEFQAALGQALTPSELQAWQQPVLKLAEVPMPASFLIKLRVIWSHLGEFKGDALLVAIVTFMVTRYILKVSIYLAAPLLALAVGTGLSYLLDDPDLRTIGGKYDSIPTDFFVFTPPRLPSWDWAMLVDIGYLVVAIVFVSGVESLLCSRMADRLADNRGTPFNPNKEFWGQGLVQIFCPLLNGFPHTGALARTATNIKVGAVTPLAGIFKCVLKLGIAYYLATYLELVPMACIGGILMWVAFNMVKPAEVKQVFAHNAFHVGLMVYTTVAVIVTDFLTGVLTAVVLYGLLFRFLDRPPKAEAHGESTEGAGREEKNDHVPAKHHRPAEERQPAIAQAQPQ